MHFEPLFYVLDVFCEFINALSTFKDCFPVGCWIVTKNIWSLAECVTLVMTVHFDLDVYSDSGWFYFLVWIFIQQFIGTLCPVYWCPAGGMPQKHLTCSYSLLILCSSATNTFVGVYSCSTGTGSSLYSHHGKLSLFGTLSSNIYVRM